MKLIDHISKHHGGNQAKFAREIDPPVAARQVTQWINKGFIVVDGVLYSPRRKLKEDKK